MEELNKAFVKMIKAYFEDSDYENLESNKGRKYNKKYFDDVGKEFLTEEQLNEQKKDEKDTEVEDED